MNLQNKAKLFWWIYTISDIVVQIFGAIVLLTTAQVAAKDNTLLTPYDIVSKIQIVIFLLYMLYKRNSSQKGYKLKNV